MDFFTTRPMDCPYLPGRLERKLLTALAAEDGPRLYDLLAQHGFRRSHNFAYRPFCEGCASCFAVRVRVADFRPTRSMRRCARANADLRAELRPPVATDEQFALFSRYVRARHGDGEMAEMGMAQYRAMLQDSTVRTTLVELRDRDGQLKAGLIADRLADGLSAVYSFFDPDRSGSPGTFIVLWTIEMARKLELPFVYLGYYVPGCHKMDYKVRFGPVELLGPSGWRHFD